MSQKQCQVWKYFDHSQENRMRCQCKFCGAAMCTQSIVMERHLLNICKERPKNIKHEVQLMQNQRIEQKHNPNQKYRQVWKYFDQSPQNRLQCKCKFCGTVICAKPDQMETHLLNTCKERPQNIKHEVQLMRNQREEQILKKRKPHTNSTQVVESEELLRSGKRNQYLKKLRNNPPIKYDIAAPVKVDHKIQKSCLEHSLVEKAIIKKQLQKKQNNLQFSEEWEIYLYRMAWLQLQNEKKVECVDEEVVRKCTFSQDPWCSKFQPYVEFVEDGEKVQKQQKYRDDMIIGFQNLTEKDQRIISAAEKQQGIDDDDEDDYMQDDDDRPWYNIRLHKWDGRILQRTKHENYWVSSPGVLIMKNFLKGDLIPSFWFRDSESGEGMLVSLEFVKKMMFKQPKNKFPLHNIGVFVDDKWIKLEILLEQLGYVTVHLPDGQVQKGVWHEFVQKIRNQNDQLYVKSFTERPASKQEIELLEQMEKYQQTKNLSAESTRALH